jgi:Helix-turn-helix domain
MALAKFNQLASYPPILTRNEVADILRLKRRYLDYSQNNAKLPPFFKVGGKILYDKKALLRWLKSQQAA